MKFWVQENVKNSSSGFATVNFWSSTLTHWVPYECSLINRVFYKIKFMQRYFLPFYTMSFTNSEIIWMRRAENFLQKRFACWLCARNTRSRENQHQLAYSNIRLLLCSFLTQMRLRSHIINVLSCYTDRKIQSPP